jgi:hypothetical protein
LWRAIRQKALDTDTTAQALVIEALAAAFADNPKPTPKRKRS